MSFTNFLRKILTIYFNNFFNFSPAATPINIFDAIKSISTVRGGEILSFDNHRFVQYQMRGDTTYFRCTKFPFKCRARIYVNEKSKHAEMLEKHNHDGTGTEIIPPIINQQSKIVGQLLQFTKDVTNDVELITNDRDVTLMFLKGFKFTKYFENEIFTR